ncbi:hypothetical protein BH23ACT6_BH23ACT6_05890 [soil metagenome]
MAAPREDGAARTTATPATPSASRDGDDASATTSVEDERPATVVQWDETGNSGYTEPDVPTWDARSAQDSQEWAELIADVSR